MKVRIFGKASIAITAIGIAVTLIGSAFDPTYVLAGSGMLLVAAAVGMGITGYCHYKAGEQEDTWASMLYVAAAFFVNLVIMFTLIYLVAAGYEMTGY